MSEQPVPERVPDGAVLEHLDEAECLRLIAPGGIGRVAYTATYDLTVLPVNYKLRDGAILFRTSADSLTVDDLRTGFEGAECRVAFEVDDFSHATRDGGASSFKGPRITSTTKPSALTRWPLGWRRGRAESAIT